MPTRRDFLKDATGGSMFLSVAGSGKVFAESQSDMRLTPPTPSPLHPPPSPLTLHPATWLWYPSERTLANTFVLFRKEVSLPSPLLRVTGWVTADSRYEFRVNGMRIQWGPAPCDPRRLEADPIEITRMSNTSAIVQGAIEKEIIGNRTIILGAIALYYGHGDGTSPIGKPGFICVLDLTLENGTTVQVTSDTSWQAHLARCWPPGQ